MGSFVDGLIAGFGIAIPIGAISILLITLSMEKGLRPGLIAAVAISSVDLTFAAIAMVAGSAVVVILAPYEVALKVVGGVTLIALGTYGLMKIRKGRGNEAASLSEGRIFIQFFVLTALNPFTIVYFLALITGNGSGWTYTWQDMFLFIIGAGLASLSWQLLLAYLGATAKRFFSPRFLVATVVIGNVLVMALGLQVLLS